MKRWKINSYDAQKVKKITSSSDLTSLCAEVLVSRGLDSIDVLKDFFNNDELSDPMLIKDMPKAVEIILEAIDNGEKICVYGDYDCDGVTSAVILVNYLECSGADVTCYIPMRDEGYGLNKEAVKKLYDDGVSLIITVDNGISSVEEAEYADELGIKLVVTDHHQPGSELPRALAVVDPHRGDCPSPYKELAGVGVALKLCAAIDGGYSAVMEQYADFAALGTIADIVPLNGENRVIVNHGLELIKNTENYGLYCLLQKCGINPCDITSTAAAFMLAPRINAAGRFGSAMTAVKAFLSEDDSASYNVDELCMLNDRRKDTELKILKEIFEYIDANPSVLNERVLVLAGKGWHHGVIGIVSSKLLNIYGKPNFIISFDDGGIGRGSARGTDGFNVFKCLEYCSDLLVRFGGHKRAGGLTISKDCIEAFIARVREYSDKEKICAVDCITADKVLEAKDLSVDMIESLKVLEPFGEGNAAPVFAVLKANVRKIVPLSSGKHSKIEFSYDGVYQTALFFSRPPQTLSFNVGDNIDMMLNAEINTYNNIKSISLKVIDYRLSGINQEQYFAAKSCYEAYMRGEGIPQNVRHRVIPSRDELVKIYKYIMAVKTTTVDRLFMKFNIPSMNYFKLRVCIDIFDELGLIGFLPSRQQVTVKEVSHRVDIESSGALKKLKSVL